MHAITHRHAGGLARLPAVLALLLILSEAAFGQVPGTCQIGSAQERLDVNNVAATVFNTGALFYGGTTTAGNGYLVPKAREKSPIFAASLWVGGKVNGSLRVAAARYGNWDFWPGPLGVDARPANPFSCAAFDRIYSVSRGDIHRFDRGLGASDDLRDWPVELGAPVIDGDGVPDNFNIEGGDRPEIVGDQGVWWLMNDVGNVHPTTGSTDALGIEVHALAYAFARPSAIGDMTFYRFSVTNRNVVSIDSMYVGLYSDPDMGDAGDDYVGFDALRGMVYVCNADNDDGSQSGYEIPPAAGFDFVTTPVVNGAELGVTGSAIVFKHGDPPYQEPLDDISYYNRLKGLWGDGSAMIASGVGIGPPGSEPATRFGYTGDPVTGEGWSELCPDPGSPANLAGDRRMMQSTGPFTLQPNETQELTIAIVSAQGSDHLDSILELRKASDLGQMVSDAVFRIDPNLHLPPLCASAERGSGRCLDVVSSGTGATLTWGYPTDDANYLGQFDEPDAFLARQFASDSTYTLAGCRSNPSGLRPRLSTDLCVAKCSP